MTPEILTMIAIGLALAGLILRQGARLDRRIDRLDADLRGEIADLRDEIIDMRERLARVEGMLETIFRLQDVLPRDHDKAA